MNDDLNYSEAGLALTKFYEGLRLTAYVDSIGVLTIGYGHTGKDVHAGMTITAEQSDILLRQDISNAMRVVRSLVRVRLEQGQFDALVDFVFNLGSLQTSTLLKKLNSSDVEGAAQEFRRWNKAGGKPVKGLTKRRAAEETMFRGYSKALAVACPRCTQQLWEPCRLGVDITGIPHAERIEAGSFVAGADGKTVAITDDSILKTGLV